MSTPGEVLSFAVANEGADAVTLEAALRLLGIMAARLGDRAREQIASDGRFAVLLSALTTRLEASDSKTLARAADAAARFRGATPELVAVAEHAAASAVVRHNAFSPSGLSMLALALAARGIQHVPGVAVDPAARIGAVASFVRGEAMRQLQGFDAMCCMALLEAFRRWGIQDLELTNMVLERLWDTCDELRLKDLVDMLRLLAKLGVARAALLRRLCKLAFGQLWRFTGRQLVALFHALAQLRFLSHRDVHDIIDAVCPKLGKLSDAQRAQLLLAIALSDVAGCGDIARVLVVQYDEGPDERCMAADIDFAWAVCALELNGRYASALQRALSRIFVCEPPQGHALLLKVHDVVGMGAAPVPSCSWRQALAAAASAEAARRGSLAPCREVARSLGDLGQAGRNLPVLRMQQGRQAGPFCIDLVDEHTRLVVDLEPVGWPKTRRLVHSALRMHGWRPLRLEQWDWQDLRGLEDRRAFLTLRVSQALEDSVGVGG